MDEQDVIRDQMQQTRSALAEKLEKLEDQVSATVHDASREVTETVANVTESVHDTVETVKDTVEETVENVKDTVADTIEAVKTGVSAVKKLFDVPAYVDQHPWLAVGGSIFVGYLLGDYVLSRPGRRSSGARTGGLAAAMSTTSLGMSELPGGNGHMNGRRSTPETSSCSERPSGRISMLDRFEPDVTKLKGLAVGVLMGSIRDTITNAADNAAGEQLGEIIDGFTEKLGGTVMPRESKNSTGDKQRPAVMSV